MNDWSRTFEFALPTKIVFGPGTLAGVVKEFRAVGGKKPLIVTDKGIVKAGIARKLTESLEKAGIGYALFDGVEANPTDLNVEEGARLARANGADSLIAIGGGSPIDCAKSIGVLLAHGGERIKAYEGKTAATKLQPPFITIPTTAGTGSEITFSSVITDTANGYKMTVKSPFTAANTAICDPELTLSVPKPVTAATGVDALTHAIEGFTANCGNPLADAAALYAVELIWDNLAKAYENGDDLEARSAMLMGSILAGIAFSHADVASVHCVAESLGGMYDLPHGVCNAIFLPYVMEYCAPYCAERYARIAKAMGFYFGAAEEGAKLAVEGVKRLAKDVELPPFSTLPVDPGKFGQLAEMSANNGSNGSNPRPMSKEDYIIVLEKAWSSN